MTQSECRCPDFRNPQNAKFLVDLGILSLSARKRYNSNRIRPICVIVLSFFSNPSQQLVKRV
jgi:hypothetical protein